MPRMGDELLVQVMGRPMALTALRKSLVHGRGVRFCSMTALALRDHPVFLLMTGGAFQLGMFGRALFEFFIGRGMAARAISGGNISRVGDVFRRVSLVAGKAIFLRLTFGMGRMTVGAVGNKAVPLPVAGGAGHGGVLADILLQLGHLLAMATQARLGNSRGNRHHQRSMRVAVAANTPLQLEVGGVGMAGTAFRDDILGFGRMADMAVHAAYFFLVRSPCLGNVQGRLVMAFYAVSGQEFASRRNGLRPCSRGQEQPPGNYSRPMSSTVF